jgi:esterase/lipase superfamily enzyme
MLRSIRLVAAALLAAALTGCGSISTLIVPAAAPGQAHVEPVYVATVRAREADGTFGDGRSPAIAYGAYGVSVPPNHVPSESPRYGAYNLVPGRDFVIAGSRSFANGPTFGAAVRRAGNGEAFVYVHGFNTSYEESIVQLAQIGADIDLPSTRVLFAWPSQTKVTGYLHDLDSATFSRDGLAELLDRLVVSGVSRIELVGYSMGAALVMETLREMKLRGDTSVLPHLGGVVLLSPDIDVDVFRSAVEPLGSSAPPIVVYAAPSIDPLGAFAKLFAKGAPRLGALRNPAVLSDVPVTFIDVTNVPSSRQPGHLPVATAPAMIAELNAMGRPDLVTYAENAATGKISGAQITRFGKLTYVVLPKP